MQKASEYRQHAAACRSLASKMESPDERDQLLRMAEQWEQLAKDRVRFAGQERPAPGDGKRPKP